jgi:pyruvate dehydrogenase E2 component (dihydrolipoamide acetyltransferase)
MATLRPLTMPKWGIEMQEGTLAEWLVAEGDAIERGTLIALIETDKITNELEAEKPETLCRIVVPAGETRPVGTLLAVMSDGAATAAEVDAFLQTFRAADTSTAVGRGGAEAPAAVSAATPAVADDLPASAAARQLAEERGVDLSTIAGSGPGGRITHQDVDQASRPPAQPIAGAPADIRVDPALERFYASPLARRLALQHGVDLSGVTGTGRGGRISKADVLGHAVVAAPAPEATPPGETRPAPQIVPMDKIRRVVARRLTEAKQSIPHFYLRNEARVDALLDLRRQANLFLGVKVSLNDFIVRAVALALVEEPDCNIQVHGEAIHRFGYADIAVAVATERGLVTPIVRDADRLLPQEIAERTRALIAKAQAGRLGHEDMEGGSFTVSNLGMFGVGQFDAIINPPQGAILAVGGSRRVWGEQADGTGAFETRIGFTLSCDHRAIDGAAGARFLAALKRLIEAPERLFAR